MNASRCPKCGETLSVIEQDGVRHGTCPGCGASGQLRAKKKRRESHRTSSPHVPVVHKPPGALLIDRALAFSRKMLEPGIVGRGIAEKREFLQVRATWLGMWLSIFGIVAVWVASQAQGGTTGNVSLPAPATIVKLSPLVIICSMTCGWILGGLFQRNYDACKACFWRFGKAAAAILGCLALGCISWVILMGADESVNSIQRRSWNPDIVTVTRRKNGSFVSASEGAYEYGPDKRERSHHTTLMVVGVGFGILAGISLLVSRHEP